jgi:cytochrome P450
MGIGDSQARAPGCPFRPPAPTPPERRPSIIAALLRARHDLLRVLPAITYRIFMGRMPLGLRDLFFVNAPNEVRDILNRDADNYPKSRQMYRALHPLVGDGIFISNGATWARRREMVNPAFENVRLRVAFPVMQAAVDDMLARLAAVGEGEVVSLDAEMAHVTADIMFRAIFSRPLTRQMSRDVFDAFARYQASLPQFDIMEILGMPDWIPRRSLRRSIHAAQQIRDILRGLIEQRLASDAREQRDILDALLDSRDPSGKPFELEEMVDEVAVLFLAGHETSATALTWSAYLTSQRADIEQRLAEEAQALSGGAAIRFEDVGRLAIARNIFKEALRLYPPVSFITRENLAERRLRKWRIRRNSMMVISPWVIQRHQQFWQQPDCFDPDRYDRPESESSEKRAYLPFGTGQRACPGAAFAMLEGPLILSSLFQRFRISLAPDSTVEPVCRLTTRPKDSIRVLLEPRHAATARG